MKILSEEDLETATAALSPYVTRSGTHNLGDAVIGELKSLREIADAARMVVARPFPMRLDILDDLLTKVGR